jgi:hypothetical protein
MTDRSTDSPDGGHPNDGFDGDVTTIPATNTQAPTGADDDGFEILFGDELFADESEVWTERASSKVFRATWFVTTLSALLLMLGGIWLGAFLQRHETSSAVSAPSAFSGLFAPGLRATTGTGLNGSSGASTNMTSGTVTDIIGRTLYVTDSSGALVAVKVSSTTTVDRNASTTLSALKPGDTVTVQGATEKNGSVDATTISASAKGVSSSGFGGVGSFPSGVGGGSGASSGG